MKKGMLKVEIQIKEERRTTRKPNDVKEKNGPAHLLAVSSPGLLAVSCLRPLLLLIDRIEIILTHFAV